MMEDYPECLGWNSVEEVFYTGVRNSVNLNSLVPLCIYVCRYLGTIVDIRKHHYFGTIKPFPQIWSTKRLYQDSMAQDSMASERSLMSL